MTAKESKFEISKSAENVDGHCAVLSSEREGTPGRHEPQLCRHKPSRFAEPTEPPPYSKPAFVLKYCFPKTIFFEKVA